MANPEQLDLTTEQLKQIETIIGKMEADQNLTLEKFKENEEKLNKIQVGVDSNLLQQFEPRMRAIFNRFEEKK